MPPGTDGLLLVDKPSGMTSHDVVDAERRPLGTRRIGHAGTLDPMATGLLVLGVGGATRLLRYLGDLPKTYEGTGRLGEETDTLDAERSLVPTPAAAGPRRRLPGDGVPLADVRLRGDLLGRDLHPRARRRRRDGARLRRAPDTVASHGDRAFRGGRRP